MIEDEPDKGVERGMKELSMNFLLCESFCQQHSRRGDIPSKKTRPEKEIM